MRGRLPTVFAALALAATAFTQVAPANSRVHGSNLTEWLSSYWQWYYATGGTEVYRPTSKPVVFMPIPIGDLVTGEAPWTFRGTAEVTLKPGTWFVLPSFAWVTERYEPALGLPDDPFFLDEVVRTSVTFPGDPAQVPQILLDGKPVTRDYWSYYVPGTLFPSPVVYAAPSDYGSIAALGFQGVGFVYKPLSPGTHTLTIFEELKFDDLGIDVVYDNTWIIHVVPPGKK